MCSPLWLTLTLLAFAPSSSLGRPSEPTSQSLVKTLGQEIGSPSELAWQAWLLVESKGGISSALDSSNILRRITPKSIFIAPELITCPSGHSTDGRGSCRPDPIVLDEAAQKQFFLKRLNALYGKFGGNKMKPEPPQGPLQINIPISIPAKNPQPEPIPVIVAQQPVVVGNNKSEEAVAVVVYKVDNDTKKDQSSESFLLGSSNTSVPKKVAEIIVEANDTFTPEVDYKIPVSNSTNLGQQSDKKDSSEDSSPAVVLLLTPTKIPSTTEKPKEQEMSTEEPKTTETTTSPTTIVDETKFDTIQTVAPLDVETDIVDTTIRTTERAPSTWSRDDYERREQQMTTTTPVPSTLDYETAYTDEDEVEETQTPEQESEERVEEEYEDEFTEDELLKPGEAGMMMSAKNQELLRSKTHTTVPVTATTIMQDTTTIPPTVGVYEEKESTIKDEVTGFTTQTTDIPSTIVSVTEETTTTTTTSTTTTPRPRRVTATIQINPKPILERYTPTRRQPTTTYTTRPTENLSEPPSFFLQRQPAQRKPSFTVNDEPHFFKDSGRRDYLPLEFKDQLPRDRTFVRFPESHKPQPQRGFVRFPSDDVNSIHNQDSLKDLSPFQYTSSTKSSVRWRQQKQKPMLLKFWARMPLVRDLSFYPTTSHGSHNEPIGGPTPPTARRGSIFKNEA